MLNKIKQKYFNAFTLAEVLITLGIIGIVAAMTIPSLLNSIQDSQFKSALKETYSAIANATKRAQADSDGAVPWPSSGDPWSSTDTTSMFNAYSNYMNIQQSETIGCTGGTFFASAYNNHKSSTQISPMYVANHCYARTARLNNGVSLLFAATGYDKPGAYGSIRIDVNGTKPPNEIGRDFFSIDVMKDTDGTLYIQPAGNKTCVAGDANPNGSQSHGCIYYALYDMTMP